MEEVKLSLNDLAISALRESGKWCTFLAIVGFIGIALMLFISVGSLIAMNSFRESLGYGLGGYGELGLFLGIISTLLYYLPIIYLVLSVIMIFPVYYLFNYGRYIKQALVTGNNDILTQALVNLKSHHKFIGIWTIITIALYILFFIGFIIFMGAMAGSLH